ncbi:MULTISPECIES: class I SAM-dependent methyltransferase [unclassified Streptomyces]|uniref:Class I SAM-dependent methyltransferase n=1 Tax=Streptomyces sp. NBC_00060 TaxID=2975636 RepID=A0AAU2GUJ8_9ACTN
MAIWNPSKGDLPSIEIAKLAESWRFYSVLDVGCGWGRNLVPFTNVAEILHGFDLDEQAVCAARMQLKESSAEVSVWQSDLLSVELDHSYDLVICYGVMHFLKRQQRMRAYSRLRSWVKPGGLLAVASFNALVPIPADLQPLIAEPPEDSSELYEQFSGWDTLFARSYVYEDEHEGGIKHTHSIDRLMVRAPA